LVSTEQEGERESRLRRDILLKLGSWGALTVKTNRGPANDKTTTAKKHADELLKTSFLKKTGKRKGEKTSAERKS